MKRRVPIDAFPPGAPMSSPLMGTLPPIANASRLYAHLMHILSYAMTPNIRPAFVQDAVATTP